MLVNHVGYDPQRKVLSFRLLHVLEDNYVQYLAVLIITLSFAFQVSIYVIANGHEYDQGLNVWFIPLH